MNEVLDTIRIHNSQVLYKEQHLERTHEALAFCGVQVSIAELSEYYSVLEEKFTQDVVRIIFTNNQLSQARYEVIPLEEIPVPVKLEVSPLQIQPCRFKWADRSLWQQAIAQKSPQADDLLFLTPDGYLRETSRFNVFVLDPKENVLLTPTLQSGCLNGAYRRFLLKNEIQSRRTSEKDFLLDILLPENKIFVGNSVRGLLPAEILVSV